MITDHRNRLALGRRTYIPDIKYFYENPNDSHLDQRFGRSTGFVHVVDLDARHRSLRELFVNWVEFTRERGLTFWIAHGLLIGHYWSRDILPWDGDLDVQVTAYDLLNHYVKHDKVLFNNRYCFDVNPNHRHRMHQYDNVIDARFIDTQNGQFLDVTGLTFSLDMKVFLCKSPHYYRSEDLFPLRETTFCGEKVWINHHVHKILENEYGSKCMQQLNYRANINGGILGYVFDQNKGKWVLRY